MQKVKSENPIKGEFQNRVALRHQQKELLKADVYRYSSLYLFSYSEIRSHIMVQVTSLKEWSESRFWYSKNSVIHQALQDLIAKNPHWSDLIKLLEAVKGQVGILLTNRPQREVVQWFDKFSMWDYPHPGYEVKVTIRLRKGPLPQFQPEIEPYLKKLGMPTVVVNGIVVLKKSFLVCKAGMSLSPRQIRFLELLGEKLTVYKLRLRARWTKTEGLEVFSKRGDFDEVSDSDSD